MPWNALLPLKDLDRLDLSNNRIKALGPVDFMVNQFIMIQIISRLISILFSVQTLENLSYLELSDNQISSISLRTFVRLKKLLNLKLDGNRLGDFTSSIQAIGKLINLK